MSTNQIQVRKADIEEMRSKGMTQQEIADHYKVSVSDVKRLFDNLGIKGRPKSKPVFVIVDENKNEIKDEKKDDIISSNELMDKPKTAKLDIEEVKISTNVVEEDMPF